MRFKFMDMRYYNNYKQNLYKFRLKIIFILSYYIHFIIYL